MKFIQVQASELVEFSKTWITVNSERIPITPWRAESQAMNPAATTDDILLVVAVDDQNKLHGYIGALPFLSAMYKKERLFWNSCWWVAPDAGAAISLSLFSLFLKLTGERVVFSDLTEKTVEIMKGLKKFQISSRRGVLVRYRHAWDQRIRSSKKSPRILIQLSQTGIFHSIDRILNIRQDRKLEQFSGKQKNGVRIRLLEAWSEQHVAFMHEHEQTAIHHPSNEFLDWIRKWPWLVPGTRRNRQVAAKYHFSAIADHHEIRLLEFRKDDQLSGLAVLGLRDGIWKTHYVYSHPTQSREIYHSLIRYMIGQKYSHTMISFHPELTSFSAEISLPGLEMKDLSRYTASSKSLAVEMKEPVTFQDGDGDYIFT